MPDWIAPVEAAYELSGDLSSWLLRIADGARSLFHAEIPPVAALVRRRGEAIEPIATACRDLSRVERFGRLLASRSADANARSWAAQPNLSTMSERVFAHLPEDRSRYEQILGRGVEDIVYLSAPADGAMNVIVSVPVPEIRRISAVERSRGACVAAHLGAGARLRDALERAVELPVDAVLDASGRLCDASPTAATPRARERLRTAVAQRERARTEQRSDPDAALELWQGLVAGRWSLVDRFESDGKRFIVAHRNDPGVGDPRGLTRRERQVADYVGMGRSLKEISYLLGVSIPAVSNATHRASRKLGLSGLAELAHLFAPGGLRARLVELDVGGEALIAGASPLLDELDAAQLTRAEREVALELLRGATVSAIAARRGASPRTVETQVKAVYAKLGVGSRVELAAKISG